MVDSDAEELAHWIHKEMENNKKQATLQFVVILICNT